MVSRSLARVYVLLIAHHLGAAGDDAILHARPDGRGGQADRRDPAAAEPVERRAAGGHGIARRQRRHAAEVAALPAFLCRSRPDDVIDRRGVERVAIANRRERSEEHTSELQSLMRISYDVFCVKKKKKKTIDTYIDTPEIS